MPIKISTRSPGRMGRMVGIFLILPIKHRKVEPLLDIAYCIFLHYNILFGDTENILKVYFSLRLSFSLLHILLSYFSHVCCLVMRNSVVTSDRTGNSGHKLRRGRLWTSVNTFFCWEGDWPLAQVVQRGCGVSLLRDIQKPSGYGPGQSALSVPAWSGGLEQMPSRGPFQLQPFCNSNRK